MSEAAYRPRTVAELIDTAVQLLRRNYAVLVGITAVGYIPWIAASRVAIRFLGTPFGDPTVGFGGSLVSLLIGAVGMLWFSVVSAGCIAAASDAYLGEQPDVGTALRRALRRAGPIIGTTFVTYFATALGLVLLIIPGAYFFAKYALSSSIALLEDRDVSESLQRASRLSQERKLHILGTLGAAWLIYLLLAIALGAFAALVRWANAEPLIEALITITVSPLIAVATAVLYYDLRIRAEGFDVELLERQIGGSEPAATA